MTSTTEIGREGEDRAVRYLEEEGYEILCRNYRFRKAEIDIIARKGKRLVIVEVKTRSEAFYEDLDQRVSPLKIHRIVKAADHFVRNQPEVYEVRFDIIQILRSACGYRLQHMEDAFYFF